MKKYIFGVVALVMAITTVAFTKASSTSANKIKKFNTVFFYTGTGTTAADYETPGNWTLTDPGNCGGQHTACEVDYAVTGASITDLVNYITSNGGNLSGQLTVQSLKQ